VELLSKNLKRRSPTLSKLNLVITYDSSASRKAADPFQFERYTKVISWRNADGTKQADKKPIHFKPKAGRELKFCFAAIRRKELNLRKPDFCKCLSTCKEHTTIVYYNRDVPVKYGRCRWLSKLSVTWKSQHL
jgi:hypothetical protein